MLIFLYSESVYLNEDLEGSDMIHSHDETVRSSTESWDKEIPYTFDEPDSIQIQYSIQRVMR